MKILTFTLLLLAVVIYTQGLGQNQLQTWGFNKHNQQRVHYQLLKKDGSFFSFGKKEKEFSYSPKVYVLLYTFENK